MERRPPEFEQADVERLSSTPSCQFTDGDGPEVGLLLWSNLAASQQNYIIQLWLSRSWPSLADFCHQNGLNYQSIYTAFARRRIPSAPVRRLQGDADVFRRSRETGHSAHGYWARIVEMIADRVLQRLMSDDTQSLSDLQNIALHAMKMMGGTAEAAKTLSGAASGDAMVNTELTLRQSSAIIPPDVRAQLVQAVSGLAEGAVRATERTAS